MAKSARDEFYQTREKSKSLFDNIPKTRKPTGKGNSAGKSYDLNNETVQFLRYIDYGRLRGFDMKTLMSYEISPTSFYQTKEGLMRKSSSEDSKIRRSLFRIKKDLPTAGPPPTPPAPSQQQPPPEQQQPPTESDDHQSLHRNHHH